MRVTPMRSSPKHSGVRSLLFFALVRGLRCHEGKLLLHSRGNRTVRKCQSHLDREIFKWAVGGHSEAARGAGPLGFALIRIMQTEGREKRTTDKVNYGPTNDKNTNL